MTKNYFGGLAQSEEHSVCNGEAAVSKTAFSKLYYIFIILFGIVRNDEKTTKSVARAIYVRFIYKA